MQRRMLLSASLVVVGVLSAVGVSGVAAAAGHSSGPAASKAPGAVISEQTVSAPGLDGTAIRVEYWSASTKADKPVKVSGLVIVPTGTAPSGGWPVVTWAHPTDGMTGNCAPSLDPTTDVPLANSLLAQGWELTASDYLNENAYATSAKKILPYLDATEAARNTIDIVRAARGIPAADAGVDYQVLGYSEGGQTALFVSHIAGSYAPELTLQGATAYAPASQMTTVFSYLETTSYWPLTLMAAGGLSSDYGKQTVSPKQLLTPTGVGLINSALKTEPSCIASILGLANHYSASQVFSTPGFPGNWTTVLNQNDAALFPAAGAAPVLIVQGTADAQIPPATTAALASQLCALTPAQPLERWLYSGLTHFTLFGTESAFTANGNGDGLWSDSDTIADVITWMGDRFAGGSWPDPYVPTGNGGTSVTQTDSC